MERRVERGLGVDLGIVPFHDRSAHAFQILLPPANLEGTGDHLPKSLGALEYRFGSGDSAACEQRGDVVAKAFEPQVDLAQPIEEEEARLDGRMLELLGDEFERGERAPFDLTAMPGWRLGGPEASRTSTRHK